MNWEYYEEEIIRIIKKHELEDNLYGRVRQILLAHEKYNVPPKEINSLVWEDELLNCVNFPHRSIEIVCLCQCWKRMHPSKKLPGSQPASIVRNLRHLGFEFAMQGRNYVLRRNGKQFRKIIGFDPDKALGCGIHDPELEQIFLQNKHDPLNGTSSHLEADHRTPSARLLKLGILPPTLAECNGNADKYFQALSRSNNSRKREVCKKCIEGAGTYDIHTSIPDCIPHKEKFLRYQPSDATDCGETETETKKPCFWHSPIVT